MSEAPHSLHTEDFASFEAPHNLHVIKINPSNAEVNHIILSFMNQENIYNAALTVSSNIRVSNVKSIIYQNFVTGHNNPQKP